MPSLRPPLELCKATGVSLAKGARVVVASDAGGVAKALGDVLSRDGVHVLELDGASATAEVAARIAGWLAEGPITGVFWLPALDVEPAIPEMDLASFREASRRRVKNLHAAMRVANHAGTAPNTTPVTRARPNAKSESAMNQCSGIDGPNSPRSLSSRTLCQAGSFWNAVHLVSRSASDSHGSM